ncbi:DUF6090 family protein [Winogradskyella sp. PG-2]|uniref:DUF6090 family protein n=1 Tax=Winogradskyella sp. PG-2 TaxID=754409 RepID=UPI0004586544|nr:DUF6090 family protein [Winogradskyella sp. PG-2]BAO75372.1 hypothetical protein WPG_1142 [Winogradskyella sp. PG-2]
MIKFFRRIRQQLLSEKKFSKYLIYAIGEIILVVIGILIALQINNWNEKRKTNIQLKSALKSVYNDMVSDSVILYQSLPLVHLRDSTIESLIKRSYATETNLDTLVAMMQNEFPLRWYNSPTYNKNTFTNLKNTGAFDILPNDIKLSLSEYYTTVESYETLNKTLLNQYRTQLDDFVKHYNIIGRFYNSNYNNSYIYKTSWTNVDGADFAPRVAVILAAYNVLFGYTKEELETNLMNCREILPQLKPYID